MVTAWNGLAIVALAEGGAALDRPEWVAAAARAADLLLDLHVVDGRLRRSSRDGVVGAAAGVLEDHAALADGLLALHQATGAPRWLAAATELLDVALAHFVDGDGVVFDTADDAEALLHRPREITDNATPCGSSALASALLTASVLTDRRRPLPGRRPRRRCTGRAPSCASTRASRGTGSPRPRRRSRARCRWRSRATGRISSTARGAPPPAARWSSPGRRTRPACRCWPPGRSSTAPPAAYVCRGFVCDRPVTTPDEPGLAAFRPR